MEKRAFAYVFISAMCFGCAASYHEPEPQQWEQVHKDVGTILSLETEFSSSHRFLGASILRAKEQLELEGFECFLEQKTIPTYAAPDTAFGSETKSLVYCWRRRAEDSRKICEVMWANFQVKWNDPTRPSFEMESVAVCVRSESVS